MTAEDQLELEARKDRQRLLEESLEEQRTQDQQRLCAAMEKVSEALRELRALNDVCLA